MGDMADYVLQQIELYEEHYFDWVVGSMSNEDAMDCGILDENGILVKGTTKKKKTCRYCNEAGLHWENYKGSWRLFSSKGIHNCPINPLKEIT